MEDVCPGFILWKEREMERILMLVRGERQEVCGTRSQIPNMLLSLALPQRFNSAVLGAVQYLQFPLTLTDHGFTLTLVFLFLFRLHLILSFTKGVMGLSFTPGK